MLKLNKWTGTFAEIMARRARLTAGEAYDLDHVLRPITQWRENPDVAAKVLTGIFMPPGQRWMLRIAHRGRPESDFIGSRGTSKTAVIDVVYAALKGVLYAKRKAVLLQAVGFRGGQLIFNDLEKLIYGEWYDQEGGLLFLLRSTKGDKPIKKMQNFWEVQWTSGSDYITVPTNDAEKLRGMRAHDLNLDERNFMDPLLVEKVAESFMNVLGDWKTGGEAAADNVLNSTTTVDYGWRDYAQIQQASYNNVARDRAIMKAAYDGKWDLYDDLMQRGFLKSSWFMWDYSDNFVRACVTTRTGKRYRITHMTLLNRTLSVLDQGSITWLGVFGGDADIEAAARTSYQQGTRTVSDMRGLIRYLLRHQHGTPFEAVVFRFQIRAPLYVTTQLLRHRLSSFNMESARYSELEDTMQEPEEWRLQSVSNKQGGVEILDPDCADATMACTAYEGALLTSRRTYELLLSLGVAREQARMVLPVAQYTTMIWQVNARSLMNFLTLRCDSHAQAEIREYAQRIAQCFAEACPLTYEAWLDYDYHAVTFSRREHEILRWLIESIPSLGTLTELGLTKREAEAFKARLTGPHRTPLPTSF